MAPPMTPPMLYTLPLATPDAASDNPCTRLSNAGKNDAIEYALKFSSTPEAMIHQSVGIRRMAHTDAPANDAAFGSLAPRPGSRSITRAGTSRSAGAAASAMETRQPYVCPSGPLDETLISPTPRPPSMQSD